MKYLEAVIKESLRIYPTVAYHGRTTTEDMQFGDLIIPAGIVIMISLDGILKDPTYFPDPEKFDPSRFENGSVKHPYAFIPFSAGPRNCIGQKYAMLEMKSVISKIIRNFEVSPAVPTHVLQLVSDVIVKSANGVKIRMQPRL